MSSPVIPGPAAGPPLAARLNRKLILGGLLAATVLGGAAFGLALRSSPPPVVAEPRPEPPAAAHPVLGAPPSYGRPQAAAPAAVSPPPAARPAAPAGDSGEAEAAHRRQRELLQLQHDLQEAALDAAARRQREQEAGQQNAAREERLRQEHDQALASPLVFGTTPATPSASGTALAPAIPGGAGAPLTLPLPDLAGLRPGRAGPDEAERREQFVAAHAAGPGAVLERAVLPPPSPYLISAGTRIPAALLTAINSDLPGDVVAQVTEDVYDTPAGRYRLIPAGARLLGRYDSRVVPGQDRVLLIWTRLILPDGSSIALDGMNATDAAGAAGLSDGVDEHLPGTGLAILSSALLAFGVNLVAPQQSLTPGGTLSAGRVVAGTAADEANRVGQRLVDRALDRLPTLTIRAGAVVEVMVNRDLILRPWR